MKIVIDIDEELYNYIHSKSYDEHLDSRFDYQIRFAVKDGTLLPRGHGRLTDLDELINFTYNTYGINSGKCITKDNEDIIDYIYNKAETIIEADKEVDE